MPGCGRFGAKVLAELAGGCDCHCVIGEGDVFVVEGWRLCLWWRRYKGVGADYWCVL